MRMTVTPRFNAQKIVSKTIEKFWFRFQSDAFKLGTKMLVYMQSYINSHRHRKGGTGNLARSIQFYPISIAGRVSWGIGKISDLMTTAPYYYVVNYGKKVSGERFIPGGGKGVPGYFGDGNAPNSSMKGVGTEHFNYGKGKFVMYPGVIRPINYISATTLKMNVELQMLLARLKGVK